LFVGAGLVLLLVKGREILDAVKSRLTYPRTGYVLPPEDAWDPPLGHTGALLSLPLRPAPPPDENVTHYNTRTIYVVFIWCLLYAGLNPWKPLYSPLATVALGIALYAWNRQSERPYRWWSALILALTGLALLWLDVPLRIQPLLLPLLAGAWLVAQGACTLAGYVRANPHPRVPAGARA